MAKRDDATGSTRRASAAQKAAGRANLEKGRKQRQEKRDAAKTDPKPSARTRWRQLLDGTLTVKQLDDEEITRMRVKGVDGTFNGPPPAKMPSHLAQAFHQEAIRRANDKIRTAAPEAVQALLDIGRDPDVKEGDRIRALMYVIDRGLGKTPDVIRVEGESKFDQMLSDAIGLDRDMADAAGEAGNSDVSEESPQ